MLCCPVSSAESFEASQKPYSAASGLFFDPSSATRILLNVIFQSQKFLTLFKLQHDVESPVPIERMIAGMIIKPHYSVLARIVDITAD